MTADTSGEPNVTLLWRPGRRGSRCWVFFFLFILKTNWGLRNNDNENLNIRKNLKYQLEAFQAFSLSLSLDSRERSILLNTVQSQSMEPTATIVSILVQSFRNYLCRKIKIEFTRRIYFVGTETSSPENEKLARRLIFLWDIIYIYAFEKIHLMCDTRRRAFQSFKKRKNDAHHFSNEPHVNPSQFSKNDEAHLSNGQQKRLRSSYREINRVNISHAFFLTKQLGTIESSHTLTALKNLFPFSFVFSFFWQKEIPIFFYHEFLTKPDENSMKLNFTENQTILSVSQNSCQSENIFDEKIDKMRSKNGKIKKSLRHLL